MKKILIIIFAFLFFSSCKKDLTSLNVDPKNPASVPSYALFTNAQRTIARTIASPNVNTNIFRLIEQYWTETTYVDESQYDLQTRQIPRGVWNAFYRDILRDLQESRNLIPTDVLDPVTQKPDAVKQKNELAIVDLMEVYSWYYLVTTFGDIPYSAALNIDKPFPKYDDQATIFADLLKRVDADIAAFDLAGESFGSADIIYGGDVTMWKKFAATFKLKMGMTLADVDAGLAKTTVESAIATGVFTSSDDNAVFNFTTASPNTNPVWEDLVQSGRKDFVATTTIVDTMVSLSDPRIPFYFSKDAADGYSGGTPGSSNNYATFSKPNETLTAADYPVQFLSYVEVEFYLAEAKALGFAVGTATAKEHYNNAITASISEWGGSQADATAYLANPAVDYDIAPGDYKTKIGFQKWLALYNRGWDAWTEQRRLDNPQLPEPTDALTDFPVRYTYSIDEQNINTENYDAASSKIGGDLVTTKLFWDKF